jgi:hypothetical protein
VPRFWFEVAGAGIARSGVRASLPQPQAGGNPRPPGNELQPGGGGLKQDLQPFEGTICGSVTSSPMRSTRECNSKRTS